MQFDYNPNGDIKIITNNKFYKEFIMHFNGELLSVKATNKKEAQKKIRKGFYTELYFSNS